MKVFVALLALASVASATVVSIDIKDYVTEGLFEERCYGEKYVQEKVQKIKAATKKCHQTKPTYSTHDLFELNRAVSHSEKITDTIFDDETIEEFMTKFEHFKENKVEAISNLTCVLKELQVLKTDNSINIEFMTGELLKKLPFDEELSEMFRSGMKTCYKYSNALPVEDFKNPIKKMFGKQLHFQKCAMKTKAKICTMKIVHEKMSEKYGEITKEKAAKMGLIGNKYEVTMMAKKVLKKSEPDTVKFVQTFLLTGEPTVY